jgi:kynurenine formamidase
MKIAALLCLLIAPLYSQVSFSSIVDLTYSFDEETIFWPTEDGFKLEKGFDGTTDKGYHYSANSFCTAEHGGTHIDAPIHFFEGRKSVDELELNQLIGNGIVVDISSKVESDRDYEIKAEDFVEWEKKNGRIEDGSIVLLKTGLGKHWPDRKEYLGTDERGAEAVAKLHFPGLHKSGAEWLVRERKIKAVGIESASIDYGQSTHFETHVYLGENNIPIIENVANIDSVPVKGFTILALPMKIKGGSGGPARVVALIK